MLVICMWAIEFASYKLFLCLCVCVCMFRLIVRGSRGEENTHTHTHTKNTDNTSTSAWGVRFNNARAVVCQDTETSIFCDAQPSASFCAFVDIPA